MHNSPRFASFFSGCGGFDHGFLQSGFEPIAAFDVDAAAVANFRSNVTSRVFCADLTRRIGCEDHLKGIDVLIAGPPCQGFSTVGKRDLNDDRNRLLTLTGTLAVRIRPKVLVVENVGGALAGAHARYWLALTQTLRLAGYRTHSLYCQAAHLGMAQYRKRVLLIAWRTGREASFHIANRQPKTLRTTLAGVNRQGNHAPSRLPVGTREWHIARSIRPGQKLSNVRGGPNAVATWDIPHVFGQITDHERTVLELLRRLRRQDRERDHGDADPVSLHRLESAFGHRFKRIVASLVSKGFVRQSEDKVDLVGTFNGKYRRLSWGAPSCTVDTRFGSPQYFLHPSHHRGFTVREAARIQGFPDDHCFDGDAKTQYRLIGNAVPPPMGRLAAIFATNLLGMAV